MKKGDLVKALAGFADDDRVILGGDTSSYVPEIRKICGGSRRGMPYYCVLAPGHRGDCFCGCKRVYFTPDRERKSR